MQVKCPRCGDLVDVVVLVGGGLHTAYHNNDRDELCDGGEVTSGFVDSPLTTSSTRRDGLSGLSDWND